MNDEGLKESNDTTIWVLGTILMMVGIVFVASAVLYALIAVLS